MVKIFKLLSLLILLFSTSLSANIEFEVSSSISISKIYKNQTTVLTLKISGADKDIYKDIEQPDLSNMFTIVSTSQSSSFSYINGKVNRNKEYKYVLSPLKSGIYIIDPFKVNYKGKDYNTKPLRVVVRNATIKNTPQASQTRPTKPSNINNNQLSKIFLEADISTNNIYIGESFEYSVKLYRRIRLWSSISIEQDDIQNVWQETFETSPERLITKNGTRYYELELTKKVIRPLSDGILEIPPLISRFTVDPFSGQNQLLTDVVTVNVMKLPDPIPDSFTGAIGLFQMNVSPPVLNKESNSLQIQVTISGTGNIDAITAPVIKDTAQYRVLSAPKNETSSDIKVFDYVIIPKVTGDLEIPPIEFAYFSRENSEYNILKSKPIQFKATLDSMNPSKTTFNAQDDIQFLASNSIMAELNAKLNNKIFLMILIFINIMLLSLLFIRLLSKRINIQLNSNGRSKRKILNNINQLSENHSINEMELLLIDVLNHFTDYDQRSIHPKEVEGSLIKAELSDPIVKSTMQWIKNTQIIRFSNEKDDSSNHSNSDSLKRILKHIIMEKEKK